MSRNEWIAIAVLAVLLPLLLVVLTAHVVIALCFDEDRVEYLN